MHAIMVRPLPAGCRLTAIFDVSILSFPFLALGLELMVFGACVVVPFGFCTGYVCHSSYHSLFPSLVLFIFFSVPRSSLHRKSPSPMSRPQSFHTPGFDGGSTPRKARSKSLISPLKQARVFSLRSQATREVIWVVSSSPVRTLLRSSLCLCDIASQQV